MNLLAKTLPLFLLIITNLSLLSQDCEAWFSFQQDSLDELKYHFYDGSIPQSDIISRNWDFGDGFNSTEKNPIHTYNSEGEYIISLTINTETCSDTYISQIFISDTINYCFSDFFFNIDPEDSYTVHFYGNFYSNNQGDINWNWNFGDGETSNEQNPTYTFLTDSAFNVELITETFSCTSYFNALVPVGEFANTDECEAMFSFNNIDPAGLTFEFFNESYTNNPIDFILWDFGDGQTSNEFFTVHNFDTEGEYLVTLTIETEYCSSSYSRLLYAGENSWYPDTCQAMFYFNQNEIDYHEIQFLDESFFTGEFNSWFWDFGDGNFSYEQNPVHVYENDGTYNVLLEINSTECSSFFDMQIIISGDSTYNGDIEALFYPEFLDSSLVLFHNISVGNYTHQIWDFGDGNYSYAHDPTHDFDEVGIHEIALSIGNQTDSNTTTIAINFESQMLMYSVCTPNGMTLNIKQNIENEIKVYPNPTTDKLIIETDSNSEINIYNSIGVLVKNTNITAKNNFLNVSNLPEGIYFINIKSKTNIINMSFVKIE